MIELPDSLRQLYQIERAKNWENDVTDPTIGFTAYSIQLTLALALHAEWELNRFTDKDKHATRAMWNWNTWMMKADELLRAEVIV